MSKPRENKNGAGNPRNKKSLKNWAENNAFRYAKVTNGGLGRREVRRLAIGKRKSAPYEPKKIDHEYEEIQSSMSELSPIPIAS